ncbi:MAG: purine-nucleoside phosphorylase [Paludibacteraceae bacterium]|nr:purine-nucleoside phosphorylase [Paludibacteraceae bacterium]
MKSQTPTPHIGAQYGEIAETVIMAGDPLRAKFMAERFLENPVQFNNVRSMLGYTGTYKSKRISVMGHGMGIPSIGIYTYELFNFYDVQTIIRVGSCGARQTYVQLGDLVIAQACCTDSNYAAQYNLPGSYSPIADFDLCRRAADACERLGYRYHVGNVFSADIFYCEDERKQNWTKMGVLADEMEAPALYMNAARAGKKALVICTVSDHILTGEATTAEQRQNTFTQMMDVAFSIV